MTQDKPEDLFSRMEEIITLKHENSGTDGFIAIHTTKPGPAMGGCRLAAYAQLADARKDAVGLAKLMTRKIMMANIRGGGGKTVISSHPGMVRTECLNYLADVLNELDGRYYTGMDYGMTMEDIEHLSNRTKFVTPLDIKPDVIISGINCGENVGISVL